MILKVVSLLFPFHLPEHPKLSNTYISYAAKPGVLVYGIMELPCKQAQIHLLQPCCQVKIHW